MKNLTRNTAAVLVVTLFTGLAVFSAIQLGGRLFGTPAANAQTTGAQASQQGSAYGYDEDADEYDYGQGSGGYGQGSQSYSDPYGQSGSGSSGGTSMTCPAIGCTASSCHATQ